MKLPWINTILDSLGGSKYYISFDLIKEHWQISLDPETIHKAAVISDDGRRFTFER